MPKTYGKNPLDAGFGKQKDLPVSARMQMDKDLRQLGFEGANEALKPKDGNFAMRVAEGSFKRHGEDLFFVRRQANTLAKMVGREPDPEVDAKAQKPTSKPASKIWKQEHKDSGRLSGAESVFNKLLDDMLNKMKTSCDGLVYARDFDMTTLKHMDRQTIAMYMTKAAADIQEIGQIYAQLMALLPRIEGADGATQRLNEVASSIAKMQGSLSGVHRTLRQESMTVRSGGKVHADSPPPDEEPDKNKIT